MLDDFRALCGTPLVVVCERTETGTAFETRFGYDIHNVRTVFELVQLVERQKTCPCEICFLAENAIELDRMSDRFMDLQTELASVQQQRSGLFRTLCG